jgi:transposase
MILPKIRRVWSPATVLSIKPSLPQQPSLNNSPPFYLVKYHYTLNLGTILKKMNSTVPLTLSAVTVRDDGLPISLVEAGHLLRKMLEESKLIQQAGITANQTIDCTEKTQFSNAAARSFVLPVTPTKDRLQKYNVKVMDSSEVHRLLTVWQQRSALAAYLKSTNWTATFAETVVEFKDKWLNYQLYENIKRSRALPALPLIKNVRIPVAKSAVQFCGLPILEGRKLTLPRFALWDREVNLHFEIPQKLIELHPRITKFTRPTIFLKNDEVLFDFTFEEPVNIEQPVCDSVVGVDIGKAKIFAAVRVFSDGRLSEELTPSVYTERHLEIIKKLDLEIGRIALKRSRRDILDFENLGSVAHEFKLRAKRKRVKAAADWSAVADVWAHVRPGEKLVGEKLDFNTGESQFRSSLLMKMGHVGNREGRNFVQVKADYSSQTCPPCRKRDQADEKRVFRCKNPKCGWVADRDFTAGVELGVRGYKPKKVNVVLPKGKATPKRPSKAARRRRFIDYDKRVRSAFTGAVSARATGFTEPATLVTCAKAPVDLPGDFET